MSAFGWHPRDHRAALDGMLMLTLEERGAYNTLLDLIYDRAAPIPDDSRWLAGWMGVSLKRWASLRASLLVKGKIFEVNVNGVPSLMNQRAAIEIENQAKRSRNLREIGAKGGQKRAENAIVSRENNDLGQADAQAKLKLKTETETYNPKPLKGQGDDPAKPDDVQAAFDLWNETAQRCSLPIARTLDANRRRAIRKRLDTGGLDLWREALAALERSAFLRGLRPGSDGRRFKADLTFVCQAKSYARLVEGGYGHDATPPRPPAPSGPVDPAVLASRIQHLRDTGEWRPSWGPRPEERAA